MAARIASVALAFHAHNAVSFDALRRVVESLSATGAYGTMWTETLATVHRLDSAAGTLLLSAARLLLEPGMQAISAGAVMPVRVLSNGVPVPSEQSLKLAYALAQQAPPRRVVVSLRLGSLLSLTEPAVANTLRPINLQSTDERGRSALWVDAGAAGAPEEARSPTTSLSALGSARLARFADHLAARLFGDLGPLAVELIPKLLARSRHTTDLVGLLAPYVPERTADRLAAIVAEELRLVYLRG